MERTARRLAFIAVAALALLAASCGGNQPPDTGQSGFRVRIERADGRELIFDAPAERIISLSPGHTEILFAIGAGDQVIGVDTESDFPPEADAKTKLDAESPDADAIEELQPDLIVLLAGPEQDVRALDERGLQVLSFEAPDSIAALLDQIDVIGEVTDHLEGSDSLVDSVDGRALEFLDLVGATQGPRVYHELDDEMTTASTDTLIGELYVILNADNIADDPDRPFPQLTLGAIVEADPEVIILAHSGASPESVKARPGWQDISAVKNDRVYAVDPEIVNRPGPRLVDGLETLAGLLHPELFPEP